MRIRLHRRINCSTGIATRTIKKQVQGERSDGCEEYARLNQRTHSSAVPRLLFAAMQRLAFALLAAPNSNTFDARQCESPD